MRRFLFLWFASCAFVLGEPSTDENDAVATAQRLFDAMASHNGEAVRALFVPGAPLTAVRADGAVSNSTSEQFASHVGAAKDAWLERMWNTKVLVHGGLAVVWADYDFHLNGKLSHCGVDSFMLVKGSEGWKISGIGYTTQKSGCASSPLGPPKK
jgi:hypothetical protein